MTKTAHYPESTVSPDLPQLEEAVLKRWEKDRVFEQSVEQRPESKEWVFYDGPPFANGLPHYGHLLTSYVKDIFARYHTMKGERVERRFGWDCHGLPAEMAAEKELDVSGRAAIEQYGIAKFNKYCRSSVMRYTNEWQDYINRAGRWVDFENDYKTMDQDYMESVLWAFKTLYDKGLIYESFRVMPYSWAAETPLSNFETKMDDAYRERTDKAITVAFKLKDVPEGAPEADSYYLLAWTTTPWTLPSNLALAVHPDMEYVFVTDKVGFQGRNEEKHSPLGSKNTPSPQAGSETTPPPQAGGVGGGTYSTRVPDAMEKAKVLRKSLTKAEASLWNMLKQKQLQGHKFRKQQAIGPYIADFVCHEKGLVIEVDGGQHAERHAYDAKRTAYFNEAGYEVLRVWNNEVLENKEGVYEVIREKLAEMPVRTPPPAPPASGGGVYLEPESGVEVYLELANGGGGTHVNCFILADSEFHKYKDALLGRPYGSDIDKVSKQSEALSETIGSFNHVKGAKLLNLTYEPLFPYFAHLAGENGAQTERLREPSASEASPSAEASRPEQGQSKGAFRILDGSSFIEQGSGTGIVHLAPGFGEDDQRVCAENGIDIVCPVDELGRYTEEIFDLSRSHSSPLTGEPKNVKAFLGGGEEVGQNTSAPDAPPPESEIPTPPQGGSYPLSLKGLNVIAQTEGKHEDEPYSKEQLEKYGLANLRIINWLKQTGQLIKQEDYTHSYPHCWRTDTPIIYRVLSSWYVEVTKFKDRMVELNQQINWIPEHVKDGQFGKWLENARDWSISRNRFWGCPIPVWRGDKGGIKVFGSKQDLEAFFEKKVDDLHRPHIDELTITKDGETWTRVSDVFDCWFESGSMPFAQVHYPFATSDYSPLAGESASIDAGGGAEDSGVYPPPNRAESCSSTPPQGGSNRSKDWFENHFPADFITEYIGQTRGWFYTLVVLGTALFDRIPFKNVICHGIILAEDGKKLSKRLKNYPDPNDMFDAYGADAVRFRMIKEPIMQGGNLLISKDGSCIRDVVRLSLKPFWNAYHFFTLYANADGISAHNLLEPEAAEEDASTGEHPLSTHDLDRYILAKLKESVTTIEQALDQFDTPTACRAFDGFFEVLNNWYIRRNRDRFWAPMGDADDKTLKDKQAAYDTLYTCLVTMARAAAPLLPMMSEHIYSALTEGQSVHLQDFPDVSAIGKETALLTAMDRVRQVCATALALREQENIRIRQPLNSLTVYAPDADSLKPFTAIIEDELNVKQVKLEKDLKQVAERKLKINFPVVGKRLGPKMKAITKAAIQGEWHYLPTVYEQRLKAAQSDLPERDDTAFRPAMSDPPGPAQLKEPTGEAIEIAGETLQEGEFSILLESKLGKGAQALPTQDALVTLDLELTDALLQEGIARDVIRMIQNARKQADLNITDRIALIIHATNDTHEQAIRTHEAYICEQTLAESLHVGDQPAEHESQETLEGAPLTIRFSVKRKQAA